VIELPHWLSIYDELVFYCPILDSIFIYSVSFYKGNEYNFKKNGLIYLGVL